LDRPGKVCDHNPVALREPECGPAGNRLEKPPDPKVSECTYAAEKSDIGIVPEKASNKAQGNRRRRYRREGR
jgi:hypothetical protein